MTTRYRALAKVDKAWYADQAEAIVVRVIADAKAKKEEIAGEKDANLTDDTDALSLILKEAVKKEKDIDYTKTEPGKTAHDAYDAWTATVARLVHRDAVDWKMAHQPLKHSLAMVGSIHDCITEVLLDVSIPVYASKGVIKAYAIKKYGDLRPDMLDECRARIEASRQAGLHQVLAAHAQLMRRFACLGVKPDDIERQRARMVVSEFPDTDLYDEAIKKIISAADAATAAEAMETTLPPSVTSQQQQQKPFVFTMDANMKFS